MSGRFLERWSRLKKAAETASTAEVPDGETLLANLGPDSDFGQFLRQEISEEIRRKAMKTLFAEPHFNVMDGLDIYIDDYNISEPIPAAMLAGMRQMQALWETPVESAEPAVAALDSCDILAGDGQNVPAGLSPEVPTSESQSTGGGEIVEIVVPALLGTDKNQGAGSPPARG